MRHRPKIRYFVFDERFVQNKPGYLTYYQGRGFKNGWYVK